MAARCIEEGQVDYLFVKTGTPSLPTRSESDKGTMDLNRYYPILCITSGKEMEYQTSVSGAAGNVSSVICSN